MAAPVYTTDLVDIIAEMPASTGWTLISDGGGGASSFSVPETDDFVQGANCISRNPWTAANIRGMVYNSAQTVPAGDAVFIWWKADVAQALRTKANGGIQCLIGDGTASLKGYYVQGADTYTFGGWQCSPIDPTVTPSTTVGAPGATTSYFGVRWAVASSGPSKGFPYKIDAIRRGRTLQAVSGDVGNGYATLDGAAAYQGDISRQWGLLQKQNGVYLQQGLFLLGTAGTAVDFRDSNRVIFVAATDFVGADFNTFEVRNASSRVDWTNVSISALGAVSKGRFVTTDNAVINKVGCTFTDMGTFSYLGSTLLTGCVYRRCGQITLGGAQLGGGSVVSNSTATSAVLAATPAQAASISDTVFVSAGTGHGLQITGTAANITLTDNTWTGYASTNGSTGNEAIFVNIATGSMSITITGGNTPSIRTAGCVVTIVSGAVSVTVKCVTAVGGNVSDARVLLTVNTGSTLPYNSVVTIVNSGTLATVTHTSHGLITTDKVQIKGASHWQNNGVFNITVTGANTYTYTMPAAPGSNPTGTILSTFVVLEGLTNVSGEITMSRVFASSHPVTGRARKSTVSPLYKTSPISGTLSNSSGLSATVVMISDE